MREAAIRLGPKGHLSGTLVLPAVGAGRPLAAIFCNAGVIPRMGPRRFNVHLSRELARRGIAGVRLDLSRLGDSSSPASDRSNGSQPDADLAYAIDFLGATQGVESVLLFGICSGAVQAMELAAKDERVRGIWLVDPPAYPTWRTFIARYVADLRKAPVKTLVRMAWHQTRSAKGYVSRRFRLAANTVADVDYGARAISKAAFAARMNELVERGVHVYMVYTSTRLWDYNYPEQTRDAFAGQKFIDRVRCELRPEINHVFTRCQMQQAMMPDLVAWSEECLSKCERAALPGTRSAQG